MREGPEERRWIWAREFVEEFRGRPREPLELCRRWIDATEKAQWGLQKQLENEVKQLRSTRARGLGL